MESTSLMADIVCEAILKPRFNRGNLDTTKCYIRVQNIDGKEVKTYMGKYVKTYHMGSGDGMTLHLEFNNAGRSISVSETMWGSVSGEELSYFIEASDQE